MQRYHVTLACSVVVIVGGCFNPDGGNNLEETEATGTSSTGSASTNVGTSSSGTASDATATSAPSTDSSTTTNATTTRTATDGSTDDGTTGVGVECGNNAVDDGETCDDGNTDSGDGCSAACQDETVFCEPRVIGSFNNLQDDFTHVAESGAFVAVVSSGTTSAAVTLLDIADPTDPLFQGAVNLSGAVQPIDLIARADRIFVVGDPLVTAVSVAGGSLSQVDQIDGSGEFGFQAVLQGTALYIADDSTTRVVNAAQIDTLNLTSGNLTVAGVMFPSYDGVAASANGAYISVNGQLGVFDISNPFSPSLLGTVAMAGGGGGPLRVTDDGVHVLNAVSDGFGIYDVSNAAQPEYVTAHPLPQNNVFSRGIATRGDFVYIPSSNGRLFTVDISDPTTPVDATDVNVGDTPAVDVHPGQDYLYVLEGGTVHLLADLPGYCDSVCGNGVTEYSEECDDGDLESGDECDADCTF